MVRRALRGFPVMGDEEDRTPTRSTPVGPWFNWPLETQKQKPRRTHRCGDVVCVRIVALSLP